MNGLFMAFQVVGLLLQFDVLASQAVHFVAQLEHLARSCCTRFERSAGAPAGEGVTSVPSMTKSLVAETILKYKQDLTSRTGWPKVHIRALPYIVGTLRSHGQCCCQFVANLPRSQPRQECRRSRPKNFIHGNNPSKRNPADCKPGFAPQLGPCRIDLAEHGDRNGVPRPGGRCRN